VRYFKNLRIESQPVHLDYLVAADDSEHSQRSRLTIEPLSRAIGMKPDLRFQARRPQDLAWELKSRPHGKNILICWHHAEIPALLEELGADAGRLLPQGQWPSQQFGWVLRLSYDKDGRLIQKRTKRIKEHLMPDD
jgi:YD repeat-containing protein